MSIRLTIFFISLSIICFILAIYTVQSARPNVYQEESGRTAFFLDSTIKE